MKPFGFTSLSEGKKAPEKLGVGQLEFSATFVVLPTGAKSMDADPFVVSFTEKSIVLSGVSRSLTLILMDVPV